MNNQQQENIKKVNESFIAFQYEHREHNAERDITFEESYVMSRVYCVDCKVYYIVIIRGLNNQIQGGKDGRGKGN